MNFSAENRVVELWKKTSSRLQQIVAPQTFKRWFEPIKVSHMEGDCVCLQVPSHLYRYWLEDNYGDLLKETLSSIGARPLSFRFLRQEDAKETSEQGVTSAGPEKLLAQTLGNTSRGRGSSERSVLNPTFNFSSFVVGPSNQYAHAGCWAVAQSPGKT